MAITFLDNNDKTELENNNAFIGSNFEKTLIILTRSSL